MGEKVAGLTEVVMGLNANIGPHLKLSTHNSGELLSVTRARRGVLPHANADSSV